MSLEPWAAYWELKARLDEASPQEVQAFCSAMPAATRKTACATTGCCCWASGATGPVCRRVPGTTACDDREVRCYSLLIDQIKGTAPDVPAEVRRLWHAQRDADDGCPMRPRACFSPASSSPDVWRKARLAMEANRPRAAGKAVDLVCARPGPTKVSEVLPVPASYLDAQTDGSAPSAGTGLLA
jgi:soluble lytic murein transglycosylase